MASNMKGTAMPRAPRTNKTQCPHCQTDCLTVKTDQVSRTYREITYACPECGHIFVAAVTPVRTLAPSDRPHADVRIPGAA